MNTQTAGGPGDLGRRIRHRRQALGLSTAEVAHRIGVSQERIQHIETRPFVLTGTELVRLSRALDITVGDLAGPYTSRTPPQRPAAPVLEPMRKDECVQLIQDGAVGRIAYVGVDGLVVIPVNYCTLGELIIFRTASDSAVAQYDLARIAFELDLVDEGMHEGWSVLVNGSVRPALDLEIEAVRDRVEPWAGGTRDTFMAIEPHRVTGRRIRSW